MAKRPHNEFVSTERLELDKSRDAKRAKVNDAEAEQAVNAFLRLVTNIKALDVGIDLSGPPVKRDHLPPSTRDNLKSLSRSLLHFLPAIKTLAEEEEQSPQPSSSTDGPPRSQEGQHQPPRIVDSADKHKLQDTTLKDSSHNKVQLPSFNSFTKWTVDDIPTSLPPLPPIVDRGIETAAFTHSGRALRPTDMNYERLEWIGDSYLYVISSGFIYATFPTLAPGKCSQIRETLVRNSTLSQYSLWYGFDKRANFPAEFGLDGRPGGTKVGEKEKTKVLGDIFEAYVAAVVLSDPVSGFARVSAWLKALWAGTIAKQIKEASALQQKATELPAKPQLANLIVVKGVKLRYEDAPPPRSGTHTKLSKGNRLPLYTVNVYLDGWGETGKLLGWGTAQSKSEAGHNAALNAMSNKKLIEVYAGRKRAHMAALEAQRKEEQT